MNKFKIKYSYVLFVLTLLSFFILNSKEALAQSKAEIRSVDFIMLNNEMVISYDIVRTKPDDLFNVSVQIKSKSGKVFNPVTLSGDIGDNVHGGIGKKVYWKVVEDNVSIDDMIYVEVTATLLNETQLIVKKQKPGIYVLKSVIFPGWGNYYINRKGANWLMGVAAYGCVAGAIVLNRVNASQYNTYLNEFDIAKRNQLYSKINNRQILTISLISAAGTIWLTDFIYTWIQGVRFNKKDKVGGIPKRNYSLGLFYDPSMKMSSFVLKYTF